VDKIKEYTERCCVRGKDNTINAGEAAEQNKGAGQLYSAPIPIATKYKTDLQNKQLYSADNKEPIEKEAAKVLLKEYWNTFSKIAEGGTRTADDGNDTEMSGAKFFSATQPAT
jgi:hypothetical protein